MERRERKKKKRLDPEFIQIFFTRNKPESCVIITIVLKKSIAEHYLFCREGLKSKGLIL